MNWEHLMKPVRRKVTFAWWGIGKDQPVVQWGRTTLRRAERRDAKAMSKWATESKMVAAINASRGVTLTKNQQFLRAFYRQTLAEVAEVV